MTKLRVNAFSISIDGYGAGVDQALEQPMGAGGMALHKWAMGTKTFQKMMGKFTEPLTADDVADTITWAITRPAHVNVDLLVLRPRAQAAQHLVHRTQG